MGYIQKAERIRNKIKRYTTDSMIVNLLNRLHQKVDNELLKTPWVTFLALDWALELTPNVNARHATQDDIQTILQEIWALQSLALNIKKEKGVRLPLRPFLISQLRFQIPKENKLVFLVRLFFILTSYGNSQFFYDRFKVYANVELDDFIVFSLWLEHCFSQCNIKSLSYEQLVVHLYPSFTIENIKSMVKLVGGSIIEMKDMAKNRAGPLKVEGYFAEPLLVEKPLLLLPDAIISTYIDIVSTGVSEFVMRTFKSHNHQKFRDKFTKSFERYIDDLLSTHSLEYLTENDIESFYKANNITGKIVDFIVKDKGKSIFIDAKGVEPTTKILATDSHKIIKDKLKDNLMKGIEQAIDCASKLKHSNLDVTEKINDRYIIIVTHQDFYLGSGLHLIDYLGDEHSAKMLKMCDGFVPVKNIHFCCIYNFERIISMCENNSSKLYEFLDFCSSQQERIENQTFEMGQNIQAYSICNNIKGDFPITSPQVIEHYKKLSKKLLDKVERSNKYWARGEAAIPEFIQKVNELRG